MNNIKQYSEITHDMLKPYTGKHLQYMNETDPHIEICVIKNGKRDHNIYNLYSELDPEKVYRCYEYERIAGSGVCYTHIAIYNYDDI